MRSLTWSLAIVLAALSVCGPMTAGAQRGAAPAFDGPRGYLTVDLSDGEPISAFIEVSRLLELSESQRKRLMEIRRLLRIQNHPLMARLDSLRQLAGVDLGDRQRIDRRDTDAIERFRAWSRPSVDSIRLNNDVARAEARSLLSGDQRRRMDSVVVAERDPRERASRRRPR